ncbi:MAG: ATP-dependent Clp protease proteolytic subunit [Lachnospiraceae bacterium]|nr:ATP-dependent Clp protease proteolytic subunit [Lachnospiraceae bacterium]
MEENMEKKEPSKEERSYKERQKEEITGNLVKESGQFMLNGNSHHHRIHLLNIIGEIEGHECLPSSSKTTKYEHVLPILAEIEDNDQIDGMLVLLNTVGGDVEAGLAIAEMISSIHKPVVTLVLGGGHSIGVPLSVSGDYSFIVPTATMVVHPIRMNGMVIGVKQNYEYIERMQDRIISFTVTHSGIEEDRLRNIMMNNEQLVKDIGSMLVGEEAVKEGLIDAVGGVHEAMECLHRLIKENQNK